MKSALTEMQNDIDARHHQLYVEAVILVRRVSVEPCMPRVIGRNVYRANAPASTAEEYYKINLTRVFPERCLQQLNARFQDEVYLCYKELIVIPSVITK